MMSLTSKTWMPSAVAQSACNVYFLADVFNEQVDVRSSHSFPGIFAMTFF
jgi:hypothetical protein